MSGRWRNLIDGCVYTEGVQKPYEGLRQEEGDALRVKRVLIFLFALFVVATIVDVKIDDPYGPMGPWHNALNVSVLIGFVPLIFLGPATLCGFVLWRFFFRNEPLTPGRVAMLFAVGSAMSCSWQGHDPGPVIFFVIGDIISLLFGQEPDLFIKSGSIIPMLVTGGFVAALFTWVSFRQRRRPLTQS